MLWMSKWFSCLYHKTKSSTWLFTFCRFLSLSCLQLNNHRHYHHQRENDNSRERKISGEQQNFPQSKKKSRDFYRWRNKRVKNETLMMMIRVSIILWFTDWRWRRQRWWPSLVLMMMMEAEELHHHHTRHKIQGERLLKRLRDRHWKKEADLG